MNIRLGVQNHMLFDRILGVTDSGLFCFLNQYPNFIELGWVSFQLL